MAEISNPKALRALLADESRLAAATRRLPPGAARRLEDLMRQRSRAKHSIKVLKAARKALSPEQRRAEGRELSGRIKAAERELQGAESELLALFDAPAEEGVDGPAAGGAPIADSDPAPPPVGQLRIAETLPDAAWDAFCAAHPRASLYHCRAWCRVAERGLGHPTRCWVARDADGTIHGVLPVTVTQSRLFGHAGTSIGFVNYGGALGGSSEIELALMRAAGTTLMAEGARHVEFRDTIARDGLAVRTDKACLHLRLPSSPGALWADLTPKVRAQIRKPLRETTEFVVGGAELLGEFYAVFARNMRDLGTPVYPKRLFEAVLGELGEQANAVVLRHHGRAVSAGIVLRHRDRLEIPWASTLRRANRSAMNMLFYWRVLEHAVTTGAGTFDFGRSTRDAGTYRFKRQWGAEPVPLYWHYLMPEGAPLPNLSPDNPRYRVAIALWRRLPVVLTRLIGPPIVRNIP